MAIADLRSDTMTAPCAEMRAAMAFLVDAYDEEELPGKDGKVDVRTVLHFHPRIQRR